MSKSSLDETPDLSIEEETLDSYSLVFDKVKQNFSTSSEISFAKHVLSPIDQNQTIIKEPASKFNPFLLLFVQDEEVLNSNEIDQIPSLNIKSNEHVNIGQGLLVEESIAVFDQDQIK
ncbi:unnamed protein product, partial [Adineta ricciae]